MVQKYQNKIAPIFYCRKSPKTNEKTYKYLIYSPLTEDNFTEWPVKTPSQYNWLGFVTTSQSQQSPNEFLFVSFWSEFFTSLQLSHLSKVI